MAGATCTVTRRLACALTATRVTCESTFLTLRTLPLLELAVVDPVDDRASVVSATSVASAASAEVSSCDVNWFNKFWTVSMCAQWTPVHGCVMNSNVTQLPWKIAIESTLNWTGTVLRCIHKDRLSRLLMGTQALDVNLMSTTNSHWSPTTINHLHNYQPSSQPLSTQPPLMSIAKVQSFQPWRYSEMCHVCTGGGTTGCAWAGTMFKSAAIIGTMSTLVPIWGSMESACTWGPTKLVPNQGSTELVPTRAPSSLDSSSKVQRFSGSSAVAYQSSSASPEATLVKTAKVSKQLPKEFTSNNVQTIGYTRKQGVKTNGNSTASKLPRCHLQPTVDWHGWEFQHPHSPPSSMTAPWIASSIGFELGAGSQKKNQHLKPKMQLNSKTKVQLLFKFNFNPNFKFNPRSLQLIQGPRQKKRWPNYPGLEPRRDGPNPWSMENRWKQ